ncbi:helix-turn-helix domain-containing protein [Methylobacterium sp. SI9]|uniref:helix-turn-helix domain-containing protein n=1 Tax=Methylobacterium guangdongense TaxID=3138811 RepID=UPI00313BF270
MARISLSELRTRASTVDREKVDATTEAEILAQRAADPDAPSKMPADAHSVTPPKALRVRLGLTQPEMAAALGIPVGTWRNWEQGRVRLDPTATALLRIVSREPAMALAVLAPTEIATAGDDVAEIQGHVGRELGRYLGSDLGKKGSGRDVERRADDLMTAAQAEAILSLLPEGKSTRHGRG